MRVSTLASLLFSFGAVLPAAAEEQLEAAAEHEVEEMYRQFLLLRRWAGLLTHPLLLLHHRYW